MHCSKMSLQVVLAVGGVAAVRTVEAFLEAGRRFAAAVCSAAPRDPDMSAGRPAGDVTEAR